jgi:xanthosine utilization system XapX-like protein
MKSIALFARLLVPPAVCLVGLAIITHGRTMKQQAGEFPWEDSAIRYEEKKQERYASGELAAKVGTGVIGAGLLLGVAQCLIKLRRPNPALHSTPR